MGCMFRYHMDTNPFTIENRVLVVISSEKLIKGPVLLFLSLGNVSRSDYFVTFWYCSHEICSPAAPNCCNDKKKILLWNLLYNLLGLQCKISTPRFPAPPTCYGCCEGISLPTSSVLLLLMLQYLPGTLLVRSLHLGSQPRQLVMAVVKLSHCYLWVHFSLRLQYPTGTSVMRSLHLSSQLRPPAVAFMNLPHCYLWVLL